MVLGLFEKFHSKFRSLVKTAELRFKGAGRVEVKIDEVHSLRSPLILPMSV